MAAGALQFLPDNEESGSDIVARQGLKYGGCYIRFRAVIEAEGKIEAHTVGAAVDVSPRSHEGHEEASGGFLSVACSW
jgi:hypothetical protein